ncbi:MULTISPECIES: DUF2339 domain-containing protein [unclassified Bradyrhizobium]|uniref:DUF2339 domain-containing protein n=1 Tax=unclassified Bradyrhizobium TaxID=2631580 RepID=UPI0028EE41DB|nr:MULTISPECIES: DUF2339 domain-containing protein [unclassified Bradyrhizobium]
MFDWPLDWIALLVAFAALAFARRISDRLAELQARLAKLEAARPIAAAPVVAPPLSPLQEPAEAPPMPPPLPELTEPALQPAAMASDDAAEQPPPLASPPPVPQPAAGFEERIGTRWVVWIGGLTLALGGFFMVRYSIEAGLVGPEVRVALGALFAAALLAAGEWTRRKESISQIAALPIANIPAILTAAGTAVAFATIYAAYALYEFLPPAIAFVLLGIVALGTLAAALLHGPALAGLGLVAAFTTPVLVSTGEPNYWALYIYLAIVTAAAFALARVRLWRWLAMTTIGLSFLWTLPGLDAGVETVAPHVFHVAVGFALAALIVVCGFMFGPAAENDEVEPISSVGLAVYLLGAMLVVLASFHDGLALIGFTVLVAATLAVAWRAPSAVGAVAAAAATVFLVFAEWALRDNPDLLVLPGGALPGMGPNPLGASVTSHLVTAAIFALGFGGAGFLAQGRSHNAVVPVVWSAAGVFTPLALLVALYARIAHLDRSIPFAIVAVVLAAAFAVATEALTRREERPGLSASIALFATGTLAALALALTFALEKGWLTIALALMSLGTAWIFESRPIPFLRTLAAVFAGLVVLRIGYDPRIVGADVGTTPIVNWLLWGYGVPAASFWGASYLMRRHGDDAPLRAVEAAAILFTTLLAFLEIRHAVNDGDMLAVPSLAEVGLDVCVALALAIGLERLRERSGSIVHNISAVILTGFAGGATVLGLLLFENPMISDVAIKGGLLNILILAYAFPAVLMLLLSYAVAGRRPPAYGNTLAAGALILALSYVSLEIRRIYHGPDLTAGPTSAAEQYTYSIAWLAFGVVLLGIGIIVQSQRARLASAIVIALTILKAFLIDMSALTGVWRALSFIGLGLVLVAIGWLYQKVLFRRQQQAPPAQPAA